MEQDRRLRGPQMIRNRNNKIYFDLKDIIREDVLKFLPAKSLYRFQGVCSEWRQKIVSPFFAHSQSNSFRDISGFFCQSGSKPPSFIPLDANAYSVPDLSLNFLPEPVDIMASFNGLVCCRGHRGEKLYYIYNPVTKQWKMLPKPNYDHGSDPALVLIFEPSLLNFVADYKLICAVQSINLGGRYEFEMYTSQAGSWKCLDEVYFGTMNLSPMSGVYVNGSIYWKATNAQILVFDLSIQRTRDLYGSHQILGVIDGKLCSTRDYYGDLIAVFEMSKAYTNTMEMKSRAKAWVQKHQINVGPSPRPSGGAEVDNKTRSVVFASGNWVVFTNGAKLYAYDIKTKETRCLLDGVEHDLKIVSYVNSLVEI